MHGRQKSVLGHLAGRYDSLCHADRPRHQAFSQQLPGSMGGTKSSMRPHSTLSGLCGLPGSKVLYELRCCYLCRNRRFCRQAGIYVPVKPGLSEKSLGIGTAITAKIVNSALNRSSRLFFIMYRFLVGLVPEPDLWEDLPRSKDLPHDAPDR